MKYIVVIFSYFLFVCLAFGNIQAQTIKFQLTDGTYKEYQLSDIDKLKFTNLNYNSLFVIYRKQMLPIKLYTKLIDSMSVYNVQTDSCSLVICQNKGYKETTSARIADIDSITILPWQTYSKFNIDFSGIGWVYESQSGDFWAGGEKVDSSFSRDTTYNKNMSCACSYQSSNSLDPINCYPTCFDEIPAGDIWFCQNEVSGSGIDSFFENICTLKDVVIVIDTTNSIIKSLSYNYQHTDNSHSYNTTEHSEQSEMETMTLSDIPYKLDDFGNLAAEITNINFSKMIKYIYSFRDNSGSHAEWYDTSKYCIKIISPEMGGKIKIQLTK